MEIPQVVQELLNKSINQVRSHPQHALSPYQRLEIYDSFGPTYYSEQGQARYSTFDNFKLTHADRVRARLALITAQNVLPLWYERYSEFMSLDANDLKFAVRDVVTLCGSEEQQDELEATFEDGDVELTELLEIIQQLEQQGLDSKQVAILHELAYFVEHYAEKPEQFQFKTEHLRHYYVLCIPNILIPQFLLQLSSAVLDQSLAAVDAVKHHSDIWQILGNCFGFDDEEFPAQAYDVASACYEAYHQGLGIGPYNRQEVTSKTTDADLQGDGAAAAAAHKAFAGIFDDGISTDAFDPERQKQFWEWWLLEAIPQAWDAETHYVEPKDLRTMPFRDTVEVNVHALGEFYEDDEFDDDE